MLPTRPVDLPKEANEIPASLSPQEILKSKLVEEGLYEANELPTSLTPLEILKSKLVAEGLLSADYEKVKDVDDGGKEIQEDLRVKVGSLEKARRIVQLAYEHGFGVMPIGAKTSAIGAFAAGNQARLHGLKGLVGMELLSTGKLTEISQEVDDSNKVFVEKEGKSFEVITLLNGRARLLKSLDPSVYSHRIQAWGGLTPDELNEALKVELGHGHGVQLDLTTRNQAHIAAVVATGAQGPVRANAAQTLTGLTIVNGKGEICELSGDEAKMQVGLGGLAGAIMEVELEVVRHETDEFGLFIPLKGSTEEGLKRRFPKILALLRDYSRAKKNDEGVWVGEKGNFLINGFEIVTNHGMNRTYASLKSDAKGMAGAMNQSMKDGACDVGLMINGRVDGKIVRDLADKIQQALGLLKINEGEIEYDEEQEASLGIGGEIQAFPDGKMADFREVRENMAEVARESKKEGPTQSTDFNLRILSEDSEEIERAYGEIWNVYWNYIHDFQSRGAQIHVYGHNHPGSQYIGGGIDAHIRITLPLAEGDHLERVHENFEYLMARQTQLYKDLIALNGKHGIQIQAGEKGLLLNEPHLRWMEENQPEKMEEIYQYIQKYGGETFGLREAKFKLHAHPPRLRQGILNYFAPEGSEDLVEQYQRSILYWVQHDPSEVEAKKVHGEVLGLVRDWLSLDFNDRVFFAESTEKAIHTSLLSLTDYHHGQSALDLRSAAWPDSFEGVGTVILSDSTLLDDERLAKVKKVLVLKDQSVSAEVRKKADVVIYSAYQLGAGEDMGIIVTNIDSIKYSRELKARGNKLDYVHGFEEMNARPHATLETPNLQVIGELGCALAQKLGQVSGWKQDEAQEHLQDQAGFFSLNSSPAQLSPAIIWNTKKLVEQLKLLRFTEAIDRSARVEEIKTKIRRHLGIPQNHEIFFTGSDIQAMQQIVESLKLDESVVTRHGLSGEMQFKVVQRFARHPKGVHSAQMRWHTGLNSTLGSLPEEVRDNFSLHANRSRGIFLTGTESSTGVQSNVNAFIEKFNQPDVFTIVDGTAEMGMVERDFKNIDVYFGSMESLGMPTGLNIIAVSPRAMARAKEVENESKNKPTYRNFSQMKEMAEAGQFHNLRGILQLEAVLDELLIRGGKEAMIADVRKKMRILEPLVVLRNTINEKRPISKRQFFPKAIDQARHIIQIPVTRKVVGALLGRAKGKYAESIENATIQISPQVSEEVYRSVVSQLTA